MSVHQGNREAAPEVVAMRGITKRFGGGVLANDRVDLTLHQGEILALLGENGAGKSTLMNILYGLYQPDEGDIEIHGESITLRSAADAISRGLGMVHQHFMLVPTFTVVENMMLGQSSPRSPRLEDRKAVAARIRTLSQRYGLDVDPDAYVWQLSVGQEQRVEILKTLYRGAKTLILDEPTAVLTPQEVGELLTIMRNLATDGHSIIFISHKLHEVMEVSDRVAVLRDGRLVNTVATDETTRAALGRMMVGREVVQRLTKAPVVPGEVRLKIENLHVNDDRGLPALRGMSLALRAGEIVGVAGVEGNGQRELEEAIGGLRPIEQGQIILCDQMMPSASPKAVFDGGLGHVPSDRYKTALLSDFSIADNLVLESIDQEPYTRRGFLRQGAIDQNAHALVEQYDVRTASIKTEVGNLSGGNAQKVVMARVLSREPQVLLIAQPTRGVDIGAIEYLHQELIRQRERGVAILLISTELEEILNLSDRIVVLYEGEIVGERVAGVAGTTGAIDVDELGMMMAGSATTSSNMVANKEEMK